jgi:hypothetical protein
MKKEDLVGKAVRVYFNSNSTKADMYLIVDDKYASSSAGKADYSKIIGWINSGIEMDFFKEDPSVNEKIIEESRKTLEQVSKEELIEYMISRKKLSDVEREIKKNKEEK